MRGCLPLCPPDPSRAEPGGVPPSTLPPSLPHTPGSGPSPFAVPQNMVPPLTSSSYRPPPSARHTCGMAGRPSPQSCLCWSVAQPCQKYPSRHPAPPAGGPVGARQGEEPVGGVKEHRQPRLFLYIPNLVNFLIRIMLSGEIAHCHISTTATSYIIHI